MYACYIVSFIYTCIWAELLGKRYRLCQRVWHLQLDTQNRTTEKKKTDKQKIYMKQEERWAQGRGGEAGGSGCLCVPSSNCRACQEFNMR